MRVLLIVLTLALAALLMPSPASAHVHAPAPASERTAQAVPTADATQSGHPCGVPAGTRLATGACVCPAICVPALAADMAPPPAIERRPAWTAAVLARDGVERLPPVPPPRG